MRLHLLPLGYCRVDKGRVLTPGIGEDEPGYPDDLLVVNGDPLADLTALRDVGAVYVGGRLIEPAKAVA